MIIMIMKGKNFEINNLKRSIMNMIITLILKQVIKEIKFQ